MNIISNTIKIIRSLTKKRNQKKENKNEIIYLFILISFIRR